MDGRYRGGRGRFRIGRIIWLMEFGLFGLFLPYLLSGCGQEDSRNAKIEIVFVHNNPCEACDEEGRFLETLKETVPEEGLRDLCEVQSYYAYREPGYEVVESAAEYFGLEKSDIVYPMAIVGDTCLLGYDQIRGEMAQCLETAREAGRWEAVVSSKGSGSPDAQARVLDAGENVAHLLYFYTESCPKCEKAESFLEQLPERIAAGGAEYQIVITALSVAEEDNALYFGALASQKDVPEREQQVPFLFLGDSYLSGETQIRQQTWELLEAGEGIGAVYRTDGIWEQEENPVFFLLKTAGVGFLNGFNPCALSLVLLFFSLMASLPEGFLRHGAAFLTGKFIAYVLLGMAAASAFSVIPFGSFRALRRGINLVLILICAGLAIGNFLDCYHASRGEYGKIKVQLPGGLRSRNDRLIKKIAENSGRRAFGILIFGGSMAIALGEFFCTGQIYLASILQWIQRAENGGIPVLALVVYSAALCLPALGLLILISRGKSAISLADISLKGMPWIKLCNGILFVIFAVLTAAYL